MSRATIRRSWVYLGMAATCAFAQSVAPDTAKLAALVKAPRSDSPWFGGRAPEQLAALRHEFLAWIDARMRRGVSIAAINKELRATGVHQPVDPPKPDHDPDLFEGFSGFVGAVDAKPVRNAPDLLEVRLQIGMACAFDDPVVVYERKSRRRLGWLEFPPSAGVPWRFSALQASAPDSAGYRLLAAGAAVSWCTSVHHAVRMYVGSIHGGEMTTLLARTVAANVGEREIEVEVKGSAVTFTYDADLGFGWIEKAHYSVAGGKLRRSPPISTTRAGFVTEWLAMDEGEAARWSEAAALQAHRPLAERAARTYFELESIASCPDRTWEVGAKLGDTDQLLFLRLAVPFRMISVSASKDETCRSAGWEALTEPIP